MEASQCCRTCLSVQNLNHIFPMSEHSEKYTEVIFTTTGIKVQIHDNLPKYMCSQCINFINDSHRFRQKCKDSEKSLLQQLEQKLFTFALDQEIKLETIAEFTTSIDISHYNIDNDFHDFDDNITLAEYHIKVESLPKTEEERIEEQTSENVIKDKEKLKKSIVKAEKIIQKEIRIKRKYVRRTEAEKAQEPRIKRKYVRKKPFLKKSDNIINDKDIVDGKIINDKEIVDGTNGKSKETNGENGAKKLEANVLYKCDFCPREFTVKAAMHTHKKIHTKRVVCEHCGMRFPEPRRLLRHCRAKHGYEKTDKCSYCDYRGVDADQVKVHERTHTGEKPYVCAQCGASFSRSSSYHQHVDSHLTEKTVQCTLCPRLFKSIKFMRIHRVRHTNHYTYACGVCDNLFARRYNVVKHLRRIHSLKPDNENIVRKKRPENEGIISG